MNDLIELARGEEPQRGYRGHPLRPARRRRRRTRPAATRPRPRCCSSSTPTLLAGVPARLERAVTNLLDNAVKYSPPGEPVEIRARTDGELTVRDHGPGISAEDLPHVFDRFYRGAEARGRPGSGLGLAIVRQVVRQHGGSVTAERAAGRRHADAGAPARRRSASRRSPPRARARGRRDASAPAADRSRLALPR